MCRVHGTVYTSQLVYRLTADSIFIFYALQLVKGGFCRLVKINSVILKDTAFILSKFHLD